MVHRIALALLSILVSSVLVGSTHADRIQKQEANKTNTPPPVYTANDAEALYQQSVKLTENARYGLARIKLFEAINLWEKSQQAERAVEALSQMGERHKKAGRWQDSVECYHRLIKFSALPIPTKTAALLSIAWLYSRLRQFELAKACYTQSLKLAQQVGNRSVRVWSLVGLAETCTELEEVKQANTYIEKILSINWQDGDVRLKSAVLRLVGNVYKRQGRRAEAQSAFEQALALYRADRESQDDEAQLLCDLSGLHLISNQIQEAMACAIQARDLAKRLKANEPRWRSWFALARAQRASGQTQEALKSFYRAFSLVEMQLIYLSSDSFKTGFLEEQQAIYRELTSHLMQMGRSDEAFNVVEHARARATLESLARGSNKEDSPEQKRALREISELITGLQTELRTAQLTERQQSALQARLEEAELRREETRLEVQMAHMKQFTSPATLKQVEATMLRPDETLLEFFLTEDNSFAWLITSEQSVCIPLPSRKEIEKIVRQYLALIAVRPSNMHLDRDMARQKKLAGELFDLLLGRFAKQLAPGRSLIIVPDGLLFYLPFESLVLNDHYLVEDHNITYCPSASVFGLLRSNKALKPTYQMELLAFGDPAFDLEKRNHAGRRGGGAGGPDLQLASNWRYYLPSLPYTRDELVSIAEFFPPEARRLYLGKSATEETLKREPLRAYRRLHLATHSIIDEKYPARPGIVMTPNDNSLEDGVIEIDEIAELDLNCELVVLSACQTGQGQLLSGEGVIGLARAFLYAGARSVAVSLWNVSDISAASLMKRLYKNMAANLDAATSLRRAKLELIASANAIRHPHYWASFVLIGVTE